jgi:5-methyltetrahydropteroyltriglutamate--homocysteine methyltransferase
MPLLPTTLVGSYPQPDWLVDRDKLRARLPPRVRAKEVWRIAEPFLEQAQDDATIVAIHDQERVGIDIVTDGEIRRESYSNRFATALEGVDLDNPGHRLSRTGRPDIVPRVVGPIRRREPVEVRDVQFLRANTAKPIKITLPGPFTMTQQAVDDYYGDDARLAMDYAAAINDEIHDLVRAGADVIQIDEPYLQAHADKARSFAVPAINRALDGVAVPTVLHTCFGYGMIVSGKQTGARYAYLDELTHTAAQQISIEAAQPRLDLSVLRSMADKTMMLGVLDLGTEEVETIDAVAERIRSALRHIDARRLVLAPDCGMKYLSRRSALGKLQAMVGAARLVRATL